MPEPIHIPFGGGEVIGDSPDRRVEILSDAESLHMTWSRFGPRREGADLHVHRRHHDIFYALAGEVTVRLGVEDESVRVPAGTLARVPPDVVHGFRNGTDAEMRYLNFHAPGMQFADYLRAMRDGRKFTYDQHDPPADGGAPIGEAVVGGAEALGDGVTLLVDIEEIAIRECLLEPGPAQPFSGQLRTCYVLDGELVFTWGDRELRATGGSCVQLPAGLAHTVAAVAPARFLDVHTPGR